MRFQFTDPDLEELYTSGAKAKLARHFGPDVLKGFFKVMAFITNATDERDLIQIRSLRYHALERDREGQHSLSISSQWRLIVKLIQDQTGNIVVIIEIVDYHS